MAIELKTPSADELDDVVRALRNWQRDDTPIQLHPGDLGWHWRFGAEVLAAAVRTWSRGGKILAIGFLDSPEVLRMTVAPEVWCEEELAREVVLGLSELERGVLPAGKVSVEVPDSTRVQDLLSCGVWRNGDPWTPLRLELAAPVDETDLRTEVVASPEQVSEFTAVHPTRSLNPDRCSAEPPDSPRSASITSTWARGHPRRTTSSTSAYWRSVDSVWSRTCAIEDWRT